MPKNAISLRRTAPVSADAARALAAARAALEETLSRATPPPPATALELLEARLLTEPEAARQRQMARARLSARQAYAQALPPLDSRHNIRSCIACIAVGVQQGLIESDRANRLLYAAQLALSALPTRSRRNPKPKP